MLEFLAAPMDHAFMVRALIAVVIVGAVCGAVGCFIVLRGMAFLGDALAHAILPGVAVGYVTGGGARGPLFWWALGAAVLASFGIGAISRRGRLKEDTAIGVILAGMFALGIAIVSTMRTYAVDLSHILFGNVLSVSQSDLVRVGAFGAAIVVALGALYKEFVVVSFDPVLAAMLRLPASLLNQALFLLLAVAVVVALQTVGIALVLAMLVTPAATAHLLTRRLPRMMLLASLLGAFAGAAGLYLAYYFNIASGPAIVLVSTVLFVLALIVRPAAGRHRTA